MTGGGVDYSSGPYIVTIPAGQISVPFDVPINDDNVFEENEEFLLTIDQSSSLNDVIIGIPNVTVVNISDNDGESVVLAHSVFSSIIVYQFPLYNCATLLIVTAYRDEISEEKSIMYHRFDMM